MVDAEGQTLGRLASRVALVLQGKHKPSFTRHADNGDYVVVVNARKIKVTGNKPAQKIYYRHSQYPGHLRQEPLQKLLARRPEVVLLRAVRNMLPKSKLGRQALRKLKIYAGPGHPHASQRPVELGSLGPKCSA